MITREQEEEDIQNLKKASVGVVIGLILGISFTSYAIMRNSHQPQTRDIIGDPNATDPNETYIETSQGRAYYTIDGKSIEDHFR